MNKPVNDPRIAGLLRSVEEYGDAPEACAEIAAYFECLKAYHSAIHWWERARGASIGHNRRARYMEAISRCHRAIEAQHIKARQKV